MNLHIQYFETSEIPSLPIRLFEKLECLQQMRK